MLNGLGPSRKPFGDLLIDRPFERYNQTRHVIQLGPAPGIEFRRMLVEADVTV